MNDVALSNGLSYAEGIGFFCCLEGERIVKTLTLELSDDVYERAERHAERQGATLRGKIVELITRYSAATESVASRDIRALFAALDKGRNVKSAAPLNRDELYDRAVLR